MYNASVNTINEGCLRLSGTNKIIYKNEEVDYGLACN